MHDGLYPLTDISLDRESEQGMDHVVPFAPQRPGRTYQIVEPGSKATVNYVLDHI